MMAPTARNNASPRLSARFGGPKECNGASRKYRAAVALRTDVTSPGPNPPAQALSIMAGKNVIYGTELPRVELSVNLIAKPTAAQSTAKEYRLTSLGLSPEYFIINFVLYILSWAFNPISMRECSVI